VGKKIENHADCEMGAVIFFLNAQNVHLIEIYCQLIAVYGNSSCKVLVALCACCTECVE
jgi:hypothetical protein